MINMYQHVSTVSKIFTHLRTLLALKNLHPWMGDDETQQFQQQPPQATAVK